MLAHQLCTHRSIHSAQNLPVLKGLSQKGQCVVSCSATLFPREAQDLRAHLSVVPGFKEPRLLRRQPGALCSGSGFTAAIYRDLGGQHGLRGGHLSAQLIQLMLPRRLQAIALHIVLSWGARRAAIAFFAGALGTLGLEPFAAWPVMFVSFSILVWLIDGVAATRWRGALSAAVVGGWVGFGYPLTGLYWIG